MLWSSVTLSAEQIAAGEKSRLVDLIFEELSERAFPRDMVLFSEKFPGSTATTFYFSPAWQAKARAVLQGIGAQTCNAPSPLVTLALGFPGTKLSRDSRLLLPKAGPVALPEDAMAPGTLIDGARMYAAAVDAVNDKFPNAYHVQSHLLCMSLELALKAYLRSHRWKITELEKLGHNLTKLYNRACKLGLEDTGSRHHALFVAGHNYRARLFVYPQHGVLSAIGPWRLREICRDIVCEVFAHIQGQESFKKLTAAPGLAIRSEYARDFIPSAWAEPSAIPSASVKDGGDATPV